MQAKIKLQRGRTFLLPGEWGEDFTDNTTLTCELVNDTNQIDLTVTKIDDRAFQIYASNDFTATIPKGIYSAILNRVDANYFPGGDPYVHGPETFTVEVD